MCDLGLLGQEAFERTRAFNLSFRNISERDFIPKSTRMQPRVPSGIDSQANMAPLKWAPSLRQVSFPRGCRDIMQDDQI